MHCGKTFLVAALVALHVKISMTAQREELTSWEDQVGPTVASDVILSDDTEESKETDGEEAEYLEDEELTEMVEVVGERVESKSLPIRKQNNTRKITKNRKHTAYKSKIIKSQPKAAIQGTSPRNIPLKLNTITTKSTTKAVTIPLPTTSSRKNVNNDQPKTGTNTKVAVKKKKIKNRLNSTIPIKSKSNKVTKTSSSTRSNRFWNRNRPTVRSNATYTVKQRYLKKNVTTTLRNKTKTTKAYHRLKSNTTHGWKPSPKLNKAKNVAANKKGAVGNSTSLGSPASAVARKPKPKVVKKKQNNRPRITKEKKVPMAANSTAVG